MLTAAPGVAVVVPAQQLELSPALGRRCNIPSWGTSSSAAQSVMAKPQGAIRKIACTFPHEAQHLLLLGCLQVQSHHGCVWGW